MEMLFEDSSLFLRIFLPLTLVGHIVFLSIHPDLSGLVTFIALILLIIGALTVGVAVIEIHEGRCGFLVGSLTLTLIVAMILTIWFFFL